MAMHVLETPERGHRIRFVTLCQQLLALAVVVAVLTPAARTVTMDVRPAQPVDVAPADVALRAAPIEVPTKPVGTDVDEYALSTEDADGDSRRSSEVRATERSTSGGGEVIDSEVVPVDGYGTVGVTWAPGTEVPEEGITVQVRTKTGDSWSGWTEADYHDEHGPDPTTEEGRNARPGTDAVLVGHVDAVQVKVRTEDDAPADLKLAVIDPGKASATATQDPAIDTAKLSSSGAADPVEEPDPATEGDLQMQAGSYTPKPRIYSRAQWGADERVRDRASLSYYEVDAGFVHHTVNANDYTAAEVPGIIRGIYSYHVRTRGWSDVGYNFLVDKYGRIWEGRAGGVDRAVVGAHTQGYNQYSFAMSAIGNFETARPSATMINAFAQLMAWKLSLHGVSASDTSQVLAGKRFQAINGHRDAGTTACPGKYLYAQINSIRTKARTIQRGWTGRDLESNLAGTATPDIVMRRKSDGRGMVVTVVNADGRFKFGSVIDTGRSFAGLDKIWKAGDWDRDGYVDVIGRRRSDDRLLLYRGLGGGRLAAPRVLTGPVSSWGFVAPVGDMTGDGWPDLMAQPRGGSMRIYPGHGLNGFKPSYAAYAAVAGSAHIPVGRWNSGDGAPDSIVRDGSKLTVYYGNGPGGWTSRKVLPQTASGYDWYFGSASIDGDWHTDMVARNRTTSSVYFLRGTPDGMLTPILLGRALNYDLAG